MARNDRTYDPHTRRWYKRGFSPAELMRPIEATCGKCGSDDAWLLPHGLWCPTCSGPEVGQVLALSMERERVSRGYMPIAEGG